MLAGCPRLYDLIKIKDDALRTAFFFACGNTVVAESLDQVGLKLCVLALSFVDLSSGSRSVLITFGFQDT